MTCFYNEIDPFAAAWMRELMQAGAIAEGVVDERSIIDIRPDELFEYTRCHFFAGIGVWDYALNAAGWPRDTVTWTGSCPCQPFSAAGKGKGFVDERHLWPYWFHLILVCRPEFIFGEQVASKNGLAWLDLVQADLESEGYTVGAVDTCAAGFGSPHIRQRLYWVAVSDGSGCGGTETGETKTGSQTRWSKGIPEAHECRELQAGFEGSSRECTGRLGENPASIRRGRRRDGDTTGYDGEVQAEGLRGTDSVADHDCKGLQGGLPRRADTERENIDGHAGCGGATNGSVADTERDQEHEEQQKPEADEREWSSDCTGRRGVVNGFWRNAIWLPCRDNKYRCAEAVPKSGTFPLPDGASGDLGLVRIARRAEGEEPGEEVIVYAPLVTRGKARVGRLRGYGNAICAPQAIEFVKAAMAEQWG